MAVTIKKIDDVLVEAHRFVKAAKKARVKLGEDYVMFGCTENQAGHCIVGGCKETAAVNRASMDLSRALVAMRNAKQN